MPRKTAQPTLAHSGYNPPVQTSPVEPLRAYLKGVVDFINHAFDEGKTRKEGGLLAEAVARRKELLHLLKVRRQPALVAGVRVGQSVPNMTKLLNDCWTSCYQHRGFAEKHAALSTDEPSSVDPAFSRLVAHLAPHMRTISDLIALANDQAARIPGSNEASAIKGTGGKANGQPKLPIQIGRPGRRGYPIKALNYARKLRSKNPSLKAAVLRKMCLEKYTQDDLPPDAESFRRWLNRRRANRAN